MKKIKNYQIPFPKNISKTDSNCSMYMDAYSTVCLSARALCARQFCCMHYECGQREMAAHLGNKASELEQKNRSAPVTEQQGEFSQLYLQDSAVSPGLELSHTHFKHAILKNNCPVGF